MGPEGFIRALWRHYGPELPFSAAAVSNKRQLRSVAPATSEAGLERWLEEHVGRPMLLAPADRCGVS